MKKSLAICLSMLTLLVTSCMTDGDEEVLSPYAILKSFSIGKIESRYPAFTSTGADTIVTKTIDFSSRPFSINQTTGEVYNADSLPYATKVDKVVINMGLIGYAQIYIDSIGIYDTFLSTDSLDFTTPRKFRIKSTDNKNYRDYTISVNVHKVEPEQMEWNKYSSQTAVMPLRALEFNGALCLFGEKEGAVVLAKSSLTGVPSWEIVPAGLPADANVATMQSFGDALYVVAGDGLYTSDDAENWSRCYAANDVVAIVAASNNEGEMWIATSSKLLSSTDGVNFESAGELPNDFPLYGVSLASYPLSHNKNILRYMLVGYTSEAMDGKTVVWSKLSTEKSWAKYDNANNPFPCPSLKGLSVFRYDNNLYAVGGAGTAQGKSVEAFEELYISRDNGITWKSPEGFYQRTPEELQGNDAPFVATVDSNNVMWIVLAGNELVVWKGIINRLGFKN